jgi:hypothetical protein
VRRQRLRKSGGGQCPGRIHGAMMGVTAASRSKLGAVGRGAVPGVSPIVLICIRSSARTPNLRQHRYKRIQCHHRIKR